MVRSHGLANACCAFVLVFAVTAAAPAKTAKAKRIPGKTTFSTPAHSSGSGGATSFAPGLGGNSQATTMLFEAVEKGAVDQASLAIARGASLNERGDAGQTPLMKAALFGEADIVRVLLDAGADATVGEAQGYTPLHGAGFQGRAEAARVLLQHKGANKVPNEFHADGFAPLHRACWGKDPRYADTIQAFLDFGVSPSLKTRPTKPGEDAMTPLELAQRAQNHDSVRVIELALALEGDKDDEGDL